jgi:Carboxypeptidase regulatory-like domain
MRRLTTKNLLLASWSLVILAALVGLPVSRAQDYASITGVVTDPSGAVIPGVSVVLTNQSTAASYKGETNALGSYTISNVAPGPGYKATFSINGFKSVVISGIYMNVSATATVNAKLVVGGTAETVQVSASNSSVTLNTTDATIGNNFEVDMVNELPIAIRDTPAILFTQQPGVASDSVTGARTDQTHVTLDGLDVDDRGTGEFGVVTGNAPVDSVQEFRGVTAGDTANFDSGGGGQFQLVTKSGGNVFHGSLFEYHRDTDTEANYWFNNNAGVPRAPLIRNQFGGNIGGPIKKDKAFFFFEYNGRRDDLADSVEQTVPTPAYLAGNISYINDSGADSCPTTSTYLTDPGCISQVQATTIKSNYDPQGIGQDPALAAFVGKRYPAGNDPTGGDGINTMGFRFNPPISLKENDYVSRLDYSLTTNQKLWARGSVQSQRQADDVNYATPIQFPGDPVTREINIASYGWVVGHDWAIGANKSNQFSYGTTVSRLNFPSAFNPTGADYWYGFGPLTAPYLGNYNAQARKDPVPQFRDDFTWHKGTHSFEFGGTFKYLTPYDNYVLNDYVIYNGIGGNLIELADSQRPSDILDNGSSTPGSLWDNALTFDLGRFAEIAGTFNYDANGTVVTEGQGASRKYRNYETEMYFDDSWKVTPHMTLTFGLRYQIFTVPYEMNGIESIQVNANTGKPLGFDEYFFKDRVPQNTSGLSGNNVIPDLEYVLGGNANSKAVGGYYKPSYTDFAPRFAFAWNPAMYPKTVFNGSIGIVDDHTIVSAIQYFQDHSSYLFQADNNTLYGNNSDPVGSLDTDPRFTSITAIPTPPTAPTFSSAEIPYVDSTGTPYGAGINTFSTAVDPSLRTPYNIMIDFGLQQELGGGFLLKVNYAGRLGRRLLAQVDASQVLDFPDAASGEHYSTAFDNVVAEIRAGDNPLSLPPEPWFENQVYPLFAGYSNTDVLAYELGNYFYNGDIGDFTNSLTGPEFGIPVINTNEVVPSQFSSNDFYTNKGSSNYHGMLVTLHKNTGYGLTFDLNYTWSHSIDNFSLVANGQSNYVGEFICDATKPRECRGNSDFDLTQVLNGNFVYNLPFGRGKAYGATMPIWLDEIVGGWLISGLPSWQTGTPYYANSTAYGAGYATLAPAILVGSPALAASHAHKDSATGLVFGYRNPVLTDAAFTGPVGLNLGQRNELRGPHYSDIDLGVGKTFPFYSDRYKLIFRADAFNVINHPSFSNPNATIISSQFGVINSTASTARVLQGALRVEF